MTLAARSIGVRAVVFLSLLAMVVSCAGGTRTPQFVVKALGLPGANGLVMLDYIAFDPAGRKVWVPAGNTGRVDVIDTASDRIDSLDGFPVAQVELRGKPREVGPSAVAVGEGAVYVGNRADSTICSIDTRSLRVIGCIAFAPASEGMAAAPDGLIYIAATRELWVTSGAPPIGIPAADRAIKVFAAPHEGPLSPAGRIPLPGSAEGYAVDNQRGRFYTNLEETGQTVEIDVRNHSTISAWRSCDDPSGVAVDSKRRFVFVACSDHVLVLNAADGGRVAGSITVGPGVDNIDYDADRDWLYAASADAGQLTIAHVTDDGGATLVARVATTKGTRSVIAGPSGSAYLIDPYGGRVLKVLAQ